MHKFIFRRNSCSTTNNNLLRSKAFVRMHIHLNWSVHNFTIAKWRFIISICKNYFIRFIRTADCWSSQIPVSNKKRKLKNYIFLHTINHQQSCHRKTLSHIAISIGNWKTFKELFSSKYFASCWLMLTHVFKSFTNAILNLFANMYPMSILRKKNVRIYLINPLTELHW